MGMTRNVPIIKTRHTVEGTYCNISLMENWIATDTIIIDGKQFFSDVT